MGMLFFWDLLTAVLVIFPFLTGGIWYSRPGLFIELSDLSVPTLIVAMLALIFKFGFNTQIEKSFWVRLGSKMFSKWSRELETHRARTLTLAWFAVGALWSFSSLRRHGAFDTNSFDLGIYHNAIWNFAHGNGYISAPKDGMPELIDHQSFTFLLLAPVIAVFQKSETLLILQGFWLASSGVILFFLGRQYLPRKHWAIAAFPLLFWIYHPIRNANAFDFHPETMMVPLFLGGIAGLQSKFLKWNCAGTFCLLLALGAKEAAGPIGAGIGIAWLLGSSPKRSRTQTRIAGSLLLLAGLAVFFFDVKAIPKLLGGSYPYQQLYSQFGSSIGDVLLAPIQQPQLFISTLFQKSRFIFFFWMLAPLGFVPLLNPKTFFAAVPSFAVLFLTGAAGAYRINLTYHYSIEETVGIFWAFPRGLLYLEARFAQRRSGKRTPLHSHPASHFNWAPLWVLFFAVAGMSRSELFRIRFYQPTQHHQWLSQKFLPALDPTVSIAATDSLVPHLTDRYWARNTTQLVISSYSIQYPDTRQNPHAGELVSCFIDDRSVKNWPTPPAQLDELEKTLPSMKYKEVYQCGSLRVFQQQASLVPCLKWLPQCDTNSEKI